MIWYLQTMGEEPWQHPKSKPTKPRPKGTFVSAIGQGSVSKGEIVTVHQPELNPVVTIEKQDGTKITLGWGPYCYNFGEEVDS